MKLTETKHRSITQAAKKLFIKQGFSSSSMEQIAQEAGVSKMTLYHHFPSKIELFQAVITEHWHLTMRVAEPLFDETKTPAENLQSFAAKLINFLTQKKTLDILRLLIAESKKFPELATALVTEEAGPFTQELINYLEQETSKGRLTIFDAELAGYQFLGLIKERLFWLRLFGIPKKNSVSVDETIKAAVEMFLSYYQNGIIHKQDLNKLESKK